MSLIGEISLDVVSLGDCGHGNTRAIAHPLMFVLNIRFNIFKALLSIVWISFLLLSWRS